MLSAAWAQVYEWKAEGNPVVRHKYTADPATLVYKDTLWIFAGEDFEGNQQRTHMENWCVFATTDLVHYREYPVPLRADEFNGLRALHTLRRWWKGTGRFIGMSVPTIRVSGWLCPTVRKGRIKMRWANLC